MLIVIPLMLAFAFGISLNSLADATVQGDVSVEIIYKEGYEVSNMEITRDKVTPASVKIDGKPSSDLNIYWSKSVIVRDMATKEQIVVPLKEPDSIKNRINDDANLNFEITPHKPEKDDLKKNGSFKGDYDLNLTY